MYIIMLPAKMDSFISFFLLFVDFISFPSSFCCLDFTILNMTAEAGCLYLVPDLKRERVQSFTEYDVSYRIFGRYALCV